MLWKILSGVSAVCLAVGLWFSWQNQGALKEEVTLLKRSEENTKAVNEKQKKAADAKISKAKELEELAKQVEDTKVQVTKANSDITEKQAEVETLKKSLEDFTKQVASLEEQITKAGDIKKLMTQVETLTQQVKESEAAIANQMQQKTISEEKLVAVQGEITKLQDIERRQKAGIVEPGFTARVAQAFPEYGFVVLNKGNLGGMFARASLDVKRGNSVVAKLLVRDVEQGVSVADLIPGSLAAGDSIRSGDLVVAGAKQPNAPEPVIPSSAPSAPTVAPAPGAAPMAAPSMGGGADPFGAAQAPAMAPAAPAAADPFGAPMAPAAPAAPAAGGAGTPASPSTADPFAPAAPATGGTMQPEAKTTDPFAK
jgi:hypothetical protein